MGIDLDKLTKNPNGSFIVLKNLNNGTLCYKDAAWFSNSDITNINLRRNSIEVPCSAGTLFAEVGGDQDYPEIFTSLRRPDGAEINICLVQGDVVVPDGVDPDDCDGQKNCNGGLTAHLYGDTSEEDYTKSYPFSAEELAIVFE
jgi:hypothetical protein